jgi:hypothetical protein
MGIGLIIEQLASGIGYFIAGIYVLIAFLFLLARMTRRLGLRLEEGEDSGLRGFLRNFH